MFGMSRPGRFLVAAYGPTLLVSFGFGAVVPLIALQARALGAGVGLAAFVAALPGLGQLVGDLPAGAIADRFGERRALAGACVLDALALAGAYFTTTVWAFALLIVAHGLTGSVYGLARQSYLTEAVPLPWRARAMSTLGGVFRVGGLLGPLAGALITRHHALAAAFLLAGAMSLVAGAVALSIPDLPGTGRRESGAADHATLWQILAAHRRTLLTLGIGLLALSLVRAARQAIIPLWCNQLGLDASTTSLLYSASMAMEVALFLPGGALMDRRGRWWATVPTMVIMAAGFVLLPLTHAAGTVALVAAVLGLGNGLSSGVASTLGADLAPVEGRPQFLAGWRLFADIGTLLGPLVISLVSALAVLAASSFVVAGIGVAGGWWLSVLLPKRGPAVVP